LRLIFGDANSDVKGEKQVYFYPVLLGKSFLRQFQYRLAHMLNNAGSIVFGFIYIAIWQGTLGTDQKVIGLSAEEMGYYLTFNQAMLFMTTFLIRGLAIQDGMRTGAVSLELMRPVSFFGLHLFQCLGFQLYNFLFRSIPIFFAMTLVVGLHIPLLENTPWLVLSMIVGIYNGFLLQYLVGMASFWTTDNRWAFMLNFTLIMTFSGNFVPLPLLPEPFATLSLYLPFAALQYYPTLVYLGDTSPSNLYLPTLWVIVLTLFALWLTRKARKKMEVQGG
jgi:ABC-2 type transport system permease protein